MEMFISPTARSFMVYCEAVQRNVQFLSQEGQAVNNDPHQFQTFINVLRTSSQQLELLLSNPNVRIRNHPLWDDPLVDSNTIMRALERFERAVLLLCHLADSINDQLPANNQEEEAINRGRGILLDQTDSVALLGVSRRFNRNGSIKAYLMYSQQSKFLVLVKQNWDRFTLPVIHKLQNLILNASEQIESILRHRNVRVQDHEPTFKNLFKRLKNQIHILCVLVEADDLKQGPVLNEDEINAIKEGNEIIDDLNTNILKLIKEAKETKPQKEKTFLKILWEKSKVSCDGKAFKEQCQSVQLQFFT